ncbi:recombinase family protein [Facklamia sp. P12955]|uniref:recombinase family protein n=1 Tax=Facklamia sp. P12955 TaxID=3421946 RepID=UPI003D173D2D
MQSKFYSNRVAIYCRLSKDDEQKGESASIKNQRDMLVDYCNQRSWNIHDIYIDDGYTGLNINRPSFQRMIEDIKTRKIDIVITKDLSRLGRNYLQTGRFTEEFFPKHGVRYIAINDGVDTIQDNNEIVPFKNVLNEFYSRDVSKKMKSAYLTRAKQGKFIGCLAPFGYMKDPEDPHTLIIDEETSPIVEKVFHLAYLGYGVQYIRTELRKEKIPTPTWWNRKKGLRNKYTKWEKEIEGGEFIWDCTTLTEMIQNPVYLGHTASQKANHKFKIGWLSDKPQEEWIVVEDTHQPIIDEYIFRIANEKLKSRKRPYKTGELNLFSGLIKCPDCGKSLNIVRNNSKKKEKLFTCNTYRRYGKDFCSQHRIFYDDIYEIVLEDIRKNAELALSDEERILKTLEESKTKNQDMELQQIALSIEEDSKRLKELETKVERLYDDWIDNKINEKNFNRILEKTQLEQKILQERIEKNEKLFEEENEDEENILKWLETIKQYKDIRKLDRHTLNELIEKILVYEKEVIDGEISQIIEIHYNFISKTMEHNLIYNL